MTEKTTYFKQLLLALRPQYLLFIFTCAGGLGFLPLNAPASEDNGSCIPRSQAEGPWDCKYKSAKVICNHDKYPAPSEEWKSLYGSEQAKNYIKKKYIYYNNLVEFLDWFSCQGFSVSSIVVDKKILKIAKEELFRSSSIVVQSYYNVRKGFPFSPTPNENRTLKGYNAKPKLIEFTLYFDKFGRLNVINFSEDFL